MIWNILEGARSLMGTDYPEKALVIRPGALVTSLVLNVLCSVAQLCPTLCNPMDCSLPGSSVHGILRQEYWSGLAFPSPEDLPNPEIEPASLASPVLAGRLFTTELPGKEVPNWCPTDCPGGNSRNKARRAESEMPSTAWSVEQRGLRLGHSVWQRGKNWGRMWGGDWGLRDHSSVSQQSQNHPWGLKGLVLGSSYLFIYLFLKFVLLEYKCFIMLC